jgi:hypothetical protein
MKYYIFNLIFTSTLAHNLWSINSEFIHVGFVSLDAVGLPIGKITLVLILKKKMMIILSFPPSNWISCLIKY